MSTMKKTSELFRKPGILLLVILLLGIALRTYHLTYPYLDHHSWRQTDDAMVARNLYRGGFDILQPRVDYNGNDPSIIEFELQITTFLTAMLYIPFGVEDWVGRIVPITFSVLSAVYFYKLVRFTHNERLALYSTAAYYLLPLNVFFTRVLMPESGMMFFSVAAIYHTALYARAAGSRNLAYAAAYTSLALLSKLPAAVVLLPIAYIHYTKNGLKPDRKTAAAFAIPIASAALYYGYIHYAADIRTGITYNTMVLSGNILWQMASPAFYQTLLNRFNTVVFTQAGLPLLIAGLFLAAKGSRAYYAWLLSAAAFTLATASTSQTHSYYQMPWLFPGAFFIGAALNRIHDTRHAKPLALALSAAMLALSAANMLPLYETNQTLYEAALRINELDPGHNLVVTVPHTLGRYKPEILYYADRKGWSVWNTGELTMERLRGYEAKGARYIILTKEHNAERYNLPDPGVVNYLNAKTKHDYGDYLIIRL